MKIFEANSVYLIILAAVYLSFAVWCRPRVHQCSEKLFNGARREVLRNRILIVKKAIRRQYCWRNTYNLSLFSAITSNGLHVIWRQILPRSITLLDGVNIMQTSDAEWHKILPHHWDTSMNPIPGSKPTVSLTRCMTVMHY